MRSEFSGIGAVAMIISFLAAVVVCLQVVHSGVLSELNLSSSVAWMLEIAIFGVTVCIWRPRISLGPWSVAIAALIAIRLALTATTGLADQLARHSGIIETATQVSVWHLGPRLCAVFFASMVFYPMRSLLPISPFVRRGRKRQFVNRAEETAEPKSEGSDPALWFVRGDEKIPVWMRGAKKEKEDAEAFELAFDDTIEGTVDIPLRAVLSQVPQEMISDKARAIDDATLVPVPLGLIVPQLKEARIVVRLDDLCRLLPRGTISLPEGADGSEVDAPLVLLPIEIVVPRLPEGVLELPPASAPAWASVENPEQVVFAVI